jgi:hypothetical protein
VQKSYSNSAFHSAALHGKHIASELKRFLDDVAKLFSISKADIALFPRNLHPRYRYFVRRPVMAVQAKGSTAFTWMIRSLGLKSGSQGARWQFLLGHAPHGTMPIMMAVDVVVAAVVPR